VKRKSDPKVFGRLYIANSVSLSTRVRVDIMKAIAKKLTNKVVSAHVAAYLSRLTLHVKDVRKELSSRAYTFIDSVTQFGGAVVREDLDEAYRRAGTAFVGQMEQHYVFLRERISQPPKPDTSKTGSGHVPKKGAKRSRVEDPGTSGESQSKAKK
jgi:hypothetical protein